MASPLVIGTARESLNLRELTLDDAQAYFDAVDYDRAHLSQFDDETADKYQTVGAVRESIERPTNPDKLRFGIWDDDQFVGSVNLTPELRTGVIGYWLDKRHLGHGYASLAANALAHYATEVKKLEGVLGFVAAGNRASEKVLWRAGFIKEAAYDKESVFRFQKVAELAIGAKTIYRDEDSSVADILLTGRNRATINHRSTTSYKLVTGHATMVINGAPKALLVGEEVTVPAGLPYWDVGEAILKATSQPPFQVDDVEFLE